MKKRTLYNLGYYQLLDFDMGKLIPIGLTEVLPGDTFQHATSSFMRFSPMVKPPMHPTEACIHHWFVPHRIIWEDWEDFITGETDGATFPTIPINDTVSSIHRQVPLHNTVLGYYGVPTASPTETKARFNFGSISALPLLGYYLIWNEHYRDQDLQNEKIPLRLTTQGKNVYDLDSLAFATRPFPIQWSKDYFTKARPWPQKGGDVHIPFPEIEDSIVGDGDLSFNSGGSSEDIRLRTNDGVRATVFGDNGTPAGSQLNSNFRFAGGLKLNHAELNQKVSDFRRAFALQRYAEARALHGSRYTEYLRYIGVTPSDSRLQRPEYLGGGKQTIQFSEVLKTGGGETEGAEPIGSIKGHGMGAMRSNKYRRFFNEHGYVHSFIYVRPKHILNSATEKHWFKRSKEDFFQKELIHIGQDTIWNYQVQAKSDTTHNPDRYKPFGYINRYEDYRTALNKVTGTFRDSPENNWHFARDIASTVSSINNGFIECNPTNRPFADKNTLHIQSMVRHSLRARRIVPRVGVGRVL